jgi:hypothetical protein
MLSSNNKKTVLLTAEGVASSRHQALSDPTALQTIFGQGGKELIKLMLTKYSDRIVWNRSLAYIACNHYPASYHYLPADCRDDLVDAKRVMDSLLSLNLHDQNGDAFDNDATEVTGMIAAVPAFFKNREALLSCFAQHKATTWSVKL